MDFLINTALLTNKLLYQIHLEIAAIFSIVVSMDFVLVVYSSLLLNQKCGIIKSSAF